MLKVSKEPRFRLIDLLQTAYRTTNLRRYVLSCLQGKGTEDTVNRYQGCQLLFLDIPNIHAVRDSLYRLQGVCESSAQKKWLSHLESSQWLAYITSILKVRPST